jgi:hypothetical protein
MPPATQHAILPPDVEADVVRAENVLAYLNLSDLRRMMVLDIIVSRWKSKIADALPDAARRRAELTDDEIGEAFDAANEAVRDRLGRMYHSWNGAPPPHRDDLGGEPFLHRFHRHFAREIEKRIAGKGSATPKSTPATLRDYSSTSGPPPTLDATAGFDTRRAIGCILAYVDEERREKTRFNDLNARAVDALLDDWWKLRCGGGAAPTLRAPEVTDPPKFLVEVVMKLIADLDNECQSVWNASERNTVVRTLQWALAANHEKGSSTPEIASENVAMALAGTCPGCRRLMGPDETRAGICDECKGSTTPKSTPTGQTDNDCRWGVLAFGIVPETAGRALGDQK